MLPLNRTNFKTYCLRQLGAPVIDINLDDDQIEDRIDEAVLLFQTYHYDGSLLSYMKYQLTANDLNTNPVEITVPSEIIGVTRIFTISSSQGTSTAQGFNMFDINYQIRLNELYDYTAGDYVYFEIANEHLRMLEIMFTGEIPIRYNRYTGLLYVDCQDSGRFNAGDWIVAEVYVSLDPSNTYWQDPWLQSYATALLKRQWGTNLKLYGSITLPGGMILNGQTMYNEADEDVKRLYAQLRSDYEQPAIPFIFG